MSDINFSLLPDKALTEISSKAYDDIAQPATRATGKALGTIFNCFNLLLAPLERAQLSSAAKTEAFRKSLEQKYDSIPTDELQEPDLKIVYQIADKLKYNLDNDELRELFENLLISSITNKKTVHPLFVDIVDKMTSEDALIFKFVYENALLTPDDRYPRLCLVEISEHYPHFSGCFLSCPHIRDYGNNSICERDLFWELSGAEGLPQHEYARLHLDTLVSMGLIEYEWDSHKRESIGGIYDVSIERNSIVIDFKEEKFPRLTGILKRKDIEQFLLNNCNKDEQTSIFVSIRQYRITVLGQRLFEVLRSPYDDRKLYRRY